MLHQREEVQEWVCCYPVSGFEAEIKGQKENEKRKLEVGEKE
jgi:hypothetical protein